MSYCTSRFHTIRRAAHEVMIGGVGVGGTHPVRVQSMTTSDTQDIAATVKQSIALAEVGCEIIRITAPNVLAAQCLKPIREQFTAAGFGHIPLVADIHFLPNAAMEAVEHVEKVRVNPGNYADKKKFAVREYSDSDYDVELQRLHDSFTPLVKRAKTLGRALRIGTNHGSLSDRIMNRYGDTPLGMVESALEFLRIAESHSYKQIVLSMKSSNPKVMIEAYRLLVQRMAQENMHYPLHLGVTEAGDGEDGRIKSAIGIGSLLLDGLGDTIRVSLTEDSVYEIPVAQALATKAMSLWQPTSPAIPAPTSDTQRDSIDPFHFTRRTTASLALSPNCLVGLEQPPRVIVRSPSVAALGETIAQLSSPRLIDTPAEGILVEIASPTELAAAAPAINASSATPAFFVLALAPDIAPADLEKHLPASPARGLVLLRKFSAADSVALKTWADFARARSAFLACEIDPADITALGDTLQPLGDDRLLFTLSSIPATAETSASGHAVGSYRQLAEALRRLGSRSPIWIRNTTATAICGDNTFLSRLLESAILTGSLLCDGLGDLVSIETEPDATRATKLAYNVLQGAGARISKTEFVSCPSCGRTLFDLQTTTQRIRSLTGHLKGVKLAIMGCIVNGPGEMADADFGYVGGAPGKINLYVGKTCVKYNIPQAEADQRLIDLIKEHGKWADPSPAHSA
ncbi:4-hydroxy-3-methylbut-2-en-1-yl diphosphate synthase [Nibricoccus aquaticus]|uniref:4-hydroxy-3-methylbut-2-en-1-yl diphosphate synthase (flavodoxin) n=1 Tax=Nibricoccus aquaticus TaxID=2576891 RepID=A0A290QB22_9BACT|nr:(E)-4-hydroxy-3-methylbut-2-enyl-diphosphate synthase [Nibricoccus aquaticus]ATC65895.1 4-hydroxy-3-methylbut-2-en-1-yl diphosphate synthase [Nibricoccus aquaticus]